MVALFYGAALFGVVLAAAGRSICSCIDLIWLDQKFTRFLIDPNPPTCTGGSKEQQGLLSPAARLATLKLSREFCYEVRTSINAAADRYAYGFISFHGRISPGPIALDRPPRRLSCRRDRHYAWIIYPPSPTYPRTPCAPHHLHSNDESTTGTNAVGSPAPEATPEVWDRVRALLRSLPAADSMSRSANSLEKEAQVRVCCVVRVGNGVAFWVCVLMRKRQSMMA